MGVDEVKQSAADFPTTNGAGNPELYAHLVLAREAFEFAADSQIRTDGHGVILEANHAAAALLRCPKEFLVGKPLGLFLVVGHRSRFYSALTRLWHKGFTSDGFESQVARRDETPRDVIMTVTLAQHGSDREFAHFHWRLADVTARKRAEAARDDLLRRVVTAQEDERRRVARELHDSVGQLLTGLKLAVRAVQAAGPLPTPAESRLNEVQRVADELGRTVRELAIQLRPTVLDDIGLQAALAQYVAEWAASTGIEIDFEAGGAEATRLPAEVETAVYRLVQEALTNVVRHAQAHRVSVTISRHDRLVVVAVEDDGIGFDPEAVPTGRLGLIGMSERAALAGGTFDVESRPGSGTTILARFPLPEGGSRDQAAHTPGG